MQGLREALAKVEWPTTDEVSGRFGLVIVVLLVLVLLIGSIDGLLGYLLGYIY